MQAGDDVGSGDPEQLVAAFERFTPEVIHRELLRLQPGAGGAVVDDDAFVDEVEEI